MASTTSNEDLLAHAAALLRLALPLMSRHRVPVVPHNYAVWYQYVSGVDTALREAIDEQMARGEEFTPALNDMLYQRFVLDSNEQMLEGVRQSMRALLATISSSIEQTDGGLKRFVDQLGVHCERLREGLTQEELEQVAQTLLTETCAARESSAALERSLEEGQRESETLRTELERALSDASTDPLTGLSNRRALLRAARDVTGLAGEAGVFSVVFADIDHFKQLNDQHGHLLGDKVLRYVGTVLHRSVKGRDTVARYGGEEFVLLLPETPYEGALHLAEAVRASIESGRLVRSDTRERIGTVTASLGVAEWRPGEELEQVLERADAALYRAKQAGRNRVVGERAASGSDAA